MLDAGLRVGEVVQLRESDLYFNGEPVNTIIISSYIAKNKTERTVPVSWRLGGALKEYHPLIKTDNPNSAAYFTFYCQHPMHRITTRQVERIIRAAGMKSLGRPVHPHVLRHTFASRLMRKTNIRVVQELLGHKHLASTQVYTHPNGQDLLEAINSIEIITCHGNQGAIRTTLTPGVPDRLDTPAADGDVR